MPFKPCAHLDVFVVLQSTVYGMGFAFSLMVAKKFNFMDDKREDAIFSKGLSWFAGILSVCGIGVSPPSGAIGIGGCEKIAVEKGRPSTGQLYR